MSTKVSRERKFFLDLLAVFPADAIDRFEDINLLKMENPAVELDDGRKLIILPLGESGAICLSEDLRDPNKIYYSVQSRTVRGGCLDFEKDPALSIELAEMLVEARRFMRTAQAQTA